MIALWRSNFLPWLRLCNGGGATLISHSTHNMSLVMITVQCIKGDEGRAVARRGSQGLSDIVQQHACSTKSLKPKGKGLPGKGMGRGREIEGEEGECEEKPAC